MKKNDSVTFRGVCHVFAETGTEGGHWAFQDERFMGIPDPYSFVCDKCHYVWNKKSDKRSPDYALDRECRKRKDHKWKLMVPEGYWAYEGLHVLYGGDLLTIFDKKDLQKKLWSGEVSLRGRTSYHEHIADNWIMHAVPMNVDIQDWQEWFFEQHPAELTLGPESLKSWETHFRDRAEKKLMELGRS